jgi:hypothetical protein
MSTCRYCCGAITKPRTRVCERCLDSKGRRTVREWLGWIVAKRSRLLIENRFANNMEAFEKGFDVPWPDR